MLPWRQKLPIYCTVLDHKVIWALLGFCIGGQNPGTCMVIGAKLKTKFYLNYPSARMRSEGYSTWSVCLCVCLSVCVSVTQHLTFHVFIRVTNDTNLLGGG